MKRAPTLSPTPPKVPEDPLELDEAIRLVGSMAQTGCAIRHEKQLLLAELIGALPVTADQATAWKSALKALRKTPHLGKAPGRVSGCSRG